jgi:hypothetical protein
VCGREITQPRLDASGGLFDLGDHQDVAVGVGDAHLLAWAASG